MGFRHLTKEGMKMESAARGGAEINGEDIYEMGAYLFKSLKDKQHERRNNHHLL